MAGVLQMRLSRAPGSPCPWHGVAGHGTGGGSRLGEAGQRKRMGGVVMDGVKVTRSMGWKEEENWD